MNNRHKLYVVVRADMSPGYQIVQACHAVADHERRHPLRGRLHALRGNTMVVLQVPDEVQLRRRYTQMLKATGRATIFYEPDVDECTAFAVSPSRYYTALSDLPLAGTTQEETNEA